MTSEELKYHNEIARLQAENNELRKCYYALLKIAQEKEVKGSANKDRLVPSGGCKPSP